MHIHRLPRNEALKAIGFGAVNAVLISAIMVPIFKSGLAPMPTPPSPTFTHP